MIFFLTLTKFFWCLKFQHILGVQERVIATFILAILCLRPFLLYSVTCFFSSCYRWPDSPVSRGAGKHSGVTYTAQWTYCSSGEETHSDGLVLGTSNCFIILRIRWPKRKDSDTVFHHLKHNWVSLVLYHRGLHHPQSFTATTNNNFKRTTLQQSVFFISLLWLSCVPYWE